MAKKKDGHSVNFGDMESLQNQANGQKKGLLGHNAKKAANKAEGGVHRFMNKFTNTVFALPRRLMRIALAPFRIAIIVSIFFVFILIILLIRDLIFNTVEATYHNGATQVIESKGDNPSDEDKKAIESYKATGSFTYFTLTDISAMRDYLDDVIKDDTGNKNEIYIPLTEEYGTNNINETNKNSRVVSPDDRVSLYEHMMLTSKYNFNQIKWKHYGHGIDGSDSPLQNNNTIGIRYPSDQNGTSYSTFLDMTNKYLLSYEVPMSIYSGLISNNNMDQHGAAEMAYAISKYALTDMTVNRYDCQRYDITTSYDISDFTKLQDSFSVSISSYNVHVVDEVDSQGNEVRSHDETRYNFSYNEGSLSSENLGTRNVNSRFNDATGAEDNMKEDVEVPGAVSITNKYFVKEALCLDVKITCEIMYEKYLQEDVDNRRNADEEYVAKEEPIDTYIGEGRIETVQGVNAEGQTDRNGYLNQIASAYNCDIIDEGGTVTFKSKNQYEHKVGTKYFIKRAWEDTVAATSGKNEPYKVEDLEKFNEEFSEGPVSKADFEAATTDYGYYKSLEDEKELNRIDFINSNPTIFNRYMSTIEPDSKYIGYRREYMRNSSYKDLQKSLEELYDTHTTYPYEWGKTLMPSKFSSAFSSNKKMVRGNGKFIWPVPEQVGKGCISEVKGGTNDQGLVNVINAHIWGFGHAFSYEGHTGIDIGTQFCEEYTIVAAADGVVVDSKDITSGNGTHAHYNYSTGEYDGTYASYGRTILIQHTFMENGEEVTYYTRYAHMIQRDVQIGEEVKKGQQIGIMGNTGNVVPAPSPSNRTAGRHLHFEILDANKNHLDPVTFYNEDLNGIGGGGDTFLQYIDSYENGGVYNYLYGDASYNSRLAKYITEDKQNFICYNDGVGKDDKNFGFGILHYLNGKYCRIEDYASVGITINDGNYANVGSSLCPVDKVLAVQQMIIEEKRDLVIRCIGQSNFDKLTTQQQDCLIDIAYQGCSSWSALKRLLDSGASAQDVVNMWPRLTSTAFNNQARADARKRLWLEGVYVTQFGEEI